MRSEVLLLLSILVNFSDVSAIFYDTYFGTEVSEERVQDLRRNNLIPWCAINVDRCDANQPRRADGSCNNLDHPSRGSIMTPYHRELPAQHSAGGGLRVAQSGRPLPNARQVRVALIPDGRRGSKVYTQLAVNHAVFITGDTTSVHDTINYVLVTTECCTPAGVGNPRCMPIRVADDDVHLRRSDVRCLNLTRAVTYQTLRCIPDTMVPERVNPTPPMLDLTLVYGSTQSAETRIREFSGGRLRSELIGGRDWPPSGGSVCINNQANETRCHDSGTTGANTIMGINLVYMWWFRSHNRIARALQTLNPCWEDQRLWRTAREINNGFYQNVIYYDLMASLIGPEYLLKNKVLFNTEGHVDDYDATLEPRVSVEQVTASRWFHTVQDGRNKLYTPEGKIYNELQTVDLFLRTGILAVDDNLAGLTQGVFRQAASDETDYLVDPEIGERILGGLQRASDVVSSDIMKGRDAGLPSYNSYRKRCGLPVARTFDDLLNWMPVEQVDAIKFQYETVEDLDLMVGILAEELMPGSMLGATLACISTLQLLRWRRADRFFYENSVHPGAFTLDQLREVRKMTLARLLCEHGDTVTQIQPRAAFMPTVGNEIVDCKYIPAINFEPWRDNCPVKFNIENPQRENTYTLGSYNVYQDQLPWDRGYINQGYVNPFYSSYRTLPNEDIAQEYNKDNILDNNEKSNADNQGYYTFDKVKFDVLNKDEEGSEYGRKKREIKDIDSNVLARVDEKSVRSVVDVLNNDGQDFDREKREVEDGDRIDLAMGKPSRRVKRLVIANDGHVKNGQTYVNVKLVDTASYKAYRAVEL